MRLLRRASIATRAYLDIANWREVLPKGARGEPVTEIRLRSGGSLSAPPENALWPHFSDVWYHLAYTRHSAIPRGAVVIDIGANVGVFSLFAARVAKVVYALEPATANFRRLVKNVAEAPVVALHMACAGRSGTATLDLSSNPVSFSLFSSPVSASETVTVVTLADLLASYGRCDFLKLDCEGAEFEIVLESPPAVFDSVDRIAMEYHDYLSPRSHTHRDLVARLTELGYRTKLYGQREGAGMLCAVKT